jgi:uncharacterized membrane protein
MVEKATIEMMKTFGAILSSLGWWWQAEGMAAATRARKMAMIVVRSMVCCAFEAFRLKIWQKKQSIERNKEISPPWYV